MVSAADIVFGVYLILHAVTIPFVSLIYRTNEGELIDEMIRQINEDKKNKQKGNQQPVTVDIIPAN